VTAVDDRRDRGRVSRVTRHPGTGAPTTMIGDRERRTAAGAAPGSETVVTDGPVRVRAAAAAAAAGPVVASPVVASR
jgi:hypothetical protein